MSVLVHVQSQSDKQAETFTNGDFMLLEAVVLKYAKKEKKKKKRAKGLNAKQVFQLKPEHQKYELFLPLHELWKEYIRDLCNGLKPEVRNAFNPQTIQQRLLKADFHAAILTGESLSKCPSYVGTTGILVQEMIRLQNHHKGRQTEIHTKRNSVFAVKIDGFVSHIDDSKFKLRSSEQSAKKCKVKGIIDL
uniref:Ribonuclease P protein subunit p29 n=1 Tax=Hucho hucho TaxID=62062 RepID=A0A4W5P8B8_9TELE